MDCAVVWQHVISSPWRCVCVVCRAELSVGVRYGMCGGVAACYIKSMEVCVCVVCRAELSLTLHSTQHTPPWS